MATLQPASLSATANQRSSTSLYMMTATSTPRSWCSARREMTGRPSQARKRIRGTNRDMTGQGRAAAYLRRRYTTKSEVKNLLKIIRTSSNLGCVPCQRDTRDIQLKGCSQLKDIHILQVHQWGPLRFRCALGTCRDEMVETDAMSRSADLVHRGIVPKEAVGHKD